MAVKKSEEEGTEEQETPDPREAAKSLIRETLEEYFTENPAPVKKTNPTKPTWWSTLWGE